MDLAIKNIIRKEKAGDLKHPQPTGDAQRKQLNLFDQTNTRHERSSLFPTRYSTQNALVLLLTVNQRTWSEQERLTPTAVV